MLTRIVKMHFRSEEISNFKLLYEGVKLNIAGFEGCEGVKLVQELNNPGILFTISLWKSEEHLENYRKSELFRDTWAKTKLLFAAKPMAWTTLEV